MGAQTVFFDKYKMRFEEITVIWYGKEYLDSKGKEFGNGIVDIMKDKT